jgi:peptidoglycan/LPS O-acetylase OafA/YrhL
MSAPARPETFADRRRVFAARQRRFIAVIGPCLIAALTILALGAGERLRGLPFSLAPALLIGALAAGLMVVDRDRPGPKLWLFSLLCFLVFIILVVL